MVEKNQIKFPLDEIVEVHWRDANANHGWGDIKKYREFAGPAICKSIGYLLKRDSKDITIVMSMCDNDDVADSLSIPIEWITKIRKISKKLKS